MARKRFINGKEVTKEEFEKQRSIQGFTGGASLNEEERKRQKEVKSEGVKKQDISQVAQELLPAITTPQPAPTAQQPIPEPTPVAQEQAQDQSLLQNIGAALSGRPVEIGGQQIQTGLRGTLAQEQAGQTPEVIGGTLPIGPTGLLGAFKVGGETVANPQKVVQAGNAIKNQKKVKPLLNALKKYGALVAGFVGFKVAGILNQVPEQQQALNTLGQTATTITGIVRAGGMEPTDALKLISQTRQQVLDLESDIKKGGIQSQLIKLDGRVLDINADIQDQLLTLLEAEADIREFALQQQFPELPPEEINAQLRDLERKGIIRSIDVQEAIR